MASFRASTMICRSMPFSLLTCAMTRFRSGSMWSPASGGGVRWARRPGEVELDARPLDRAESERHDSRVGIVDGDGVVRGRLEDAVELPAARDRLVDAHVHPLADGPAEVFRADEWPVDAR